MIVEKSDRQNIKSRVEFYISNSHGESKYIILQEYVEGAEKGELPLLMLHRKAIGALKRGSAAGADNSLPRKGGSRNKMESRVLQT